MSDIDDLLLREEDCPLALAERMRQDAAYDAADPIPEGDEGQAQDRTWAAVHAAPEPRERARGKEGQRTGSTKPAERQRRWTVSKGEREMETARERAAAYRRMVAWARLGIAPEDERRWMPAPPAEGWLTGHEARWLAQRRG